MSEPKRLTRLHITPAQAARWEAAAVAQGLEPPLALPADVAAYRATLVKELYSKIHAAERALKRETQPAVGASLAGQVVGLRAALALVQGAPDA